MQNMYVSMVGTVSEKSGLAVDVLIHLAYLYARKSTSEVWMKLDLIRYLENDEVGEELRDLTLDYLARRIVFVEGENPHNHKRIVWVKKVQNPSPVKG